MPDKWYRPRDAAQLLGIAASTLRGWARRFAAALSPAAAEPPRLPDGRLGGRLYNEADMKVLRRINELLAQGLSYDQVAETLNIGEFEHRAAQSAASRSVQPQETKPAAPLSELSEALRLLADQKERLDRFEARMTDMEQRFAQEYAQIVNHVLLHQSRRSGRWSRYFVWRESGRIYQFYLGPATAQEIQVWHAQVMDTSRLAVGTLRAS